MPADDDGYEPALESTTTAETSTESEPVVKRGAAAAAALATPPDPAAAAPAKIGEPPGDDEPTTIEHGPKAPRVWSSKSRALFRNVVKQTQAGEVEPATADDLEPMSHTPAAQPGAAPAAATTAPAASPVSPAAATTPPLPAPAAPVTPPPGLPPLPEMPLAPVAAAPPAPATPAPPDPKHAEREAALAAREAALVERERLLPDRRALVENPGAALVNWLKETHGITDEAELKTALADVISEASEVGLKVQLPADVKAGIEGRKATRVVRAYTSTLDARERAITEKAAAQEKAAAEARAAAELEQQEAAYVARLGELIAPAAAQHKFLHDPEITGGIPPAAIVYEVLKEQKRLGWAPDLGKAAEFANNYYKAQAEALVKKSAHVQSLLAPAAPVAAAAQPAPATASPGGAPGPAPTPQAKPEPAAAEWDPSDLPMDRQQRRQAGLRLLVQRNKAKAASGGA